MKTIIIIVEFPIFHMHYANNTPCQHAKKRFFKRIVSDQNVNTLRTTLKENYWSRVLECQDANQAYSTFRTIFQNAVDTAMPLSEIKNESSNRNKSKPWLTNDLLELIGLKYKMYKIMKVDGDESMVQKYKLIKKKHLSNSLRRAEKTYYKNLLEKNKHNLSKMWNSINLVINRKSPDKYNM